MTRSHTHTHTHAMTSSPTYRTHSWHNITHHHTHDMASHRRGFCCLHGRHSSRSLQKGMRRALSPLGRGSCLRGRRRSRSLQKGLRRALSPVGLGCLLRISHHSSQTTHLKPLISHHSSHITHFTPHISHRSSHTTERHKTSHVGLSRPFLISFNQVDVSFSRPMPQASRRIQQFTRNSRAVILILKAFLWTLQRTCGTWCKNP